MFNRQRSRKSLRELVGLSLLTGEAVVWITLARAALVLVSFQRIAPRLGRLRQPAALPTAPRPGDAMAFAVRRAIQRAEGVLPFKVVCMPAALAAWKMLSRRGISTDLHFGALPRHGTMPLLTHVWLNAGSVKVTGYPLAPGTVEVGCFACSSDAAPRGIHLLDRAG